MESKQERRLQSTLQRLAAYVFTITTVLMIALPLGTCSFANTISGEAQAYPEIFDDLGPHLEKYYWDQRRFQPKRQLKRALSSLENAADEIYVEYTGLNERRIRVHVGENSKLWSLTRITDLESALGILKSIFDFLENHYDGKTTLEDVRIATVNGFLTGLDPHTLVFGRKDFEEFNTHIQGEIFGVGMLVGVRGDGDLTVIEVLKSTPAARAGFRNGDTITRIGEESTVNMSVQEAVQRIRGKRGSEIVLTVKRKDPANPGKLVTKKIPVVRDRVEIKSVESKLLPHGIGYVKVTNFDKNTVDALKRNLRRLHAQNGDKELSGLVLDLRSNPGGLLKQASDMADLFLERGTVYSIADRNGVESFSADDDDGEPEYPIIALCNEGSASGSEIVIGALQQNDRAVVLGAQTFGKGSVQQLHPMPAKPGFFYRYKAQLKITVSEYLIPGQISIQENGVIPDILAQRVFFDASDKTEIDLFPNERRGTEADYEYHIVSKYAKDLKPLASLRYPFVYTPPDADAVGDEFMSGDIKPMEDALVRTAVKMLKLEVDSGEPSPRFSGRHFLEKHREGFDRIAEELEQEIAGHLKERGIDWTEGKNPTLPPEVALDFSHEFVERPSSDEEDPIPDTILIVKAKVTNKGDHTIYRLAGLSESDQYLYNEREFVFGKLDPGESVERSFEVKLRPLSASRIDVLSVHLTCPGVAEPFARTTHEIVLRSTSFPEFSYALTLLDDDTNNEITTLSPGTQARISARISNDGKAPVHKGVAILKNKSGRDVFLDIGRLDVKELAPGESQSVEFKFHIREDSKLEEFEFEFGVFGSHYPTGLSHTFKVPAPGNRAVTFKNGEIYKAASIDLTAMFDSQGTRTEVGEDGVIVTDKDSILLSASMADKTSPFHAWVSIQRQGLEQSELPDKISFAESRVDDTNVLKLSTIVPLEVGQNVISVTTKNERGLSRRQVMYVRRAGGIE